MFLKKNLSQNIKVQDEAIGNVDRVVEAKEVNLSVLRKN